MCFIYSTNSKVAFLEWILSNPEYTEDDRSELIDIMLVAAEKNNKNNKGINIYSDLQLKSV